MKKLFLLCLLLAFSLTACSLSISKSTLTPTSLPSLNPKILPTTSAYPAPLPGLPPYPLITTSAYPAPGPTITSTPAFFPLSGYEPQPGDNRLKRDQAVIDMAHSQLVVTTTKPVQVKAILTGSLSDPCHYLRAVVTWPGTGSAIIIQVYSLFDPNTACITLVKPFTISIPLGSYATGQHVVYVAANVVEPLGQIDASYAAQPGDVLLSRAGVILDMSHTALATTGGLWNMPAVKLEGYLPDSCQQLRIVMPPPDSENKVNLDVYSVSDPQTSCTGVVQPFQVIYPLGYAGSGQSQVYVNGQYLGKFDWGG